MTAPGIVELLFIEDRPIKPMPVNRERILKAQGLAIRSRIEWAMVLAAMSEDQRATVQRALVE